MVQIREKEKMFCLKVVTFLVFVPRVYSDLTLSSADLTGVHLTGPELCSKVFSLTFTMPLSLHPAPLGLCLLLPGRYMQSSLRLLVLFKELIWMG